MTRISVALKRVGVVFKIRKKHSIISKRQYTIYGFNVRSSSFVLTPSANYYLIENGVIRRYVRSKDLEYGQLFIEGEGTVEYFFRILKMTPTLFNAKNKLVIRKFRRYKLHHFIG